MILYFTATGNSLYVAKNLDEELISIPKELNKKNRIYKADRIGIVCPLFEFEMPEMVKEFIRTSVFETDYFYVVITYGCHHGGVAERTDKYLKSIGINADYINTIIMHDNAIIVFDMDEQRLIEDSKEVDKHIKLLKNDISNNLEMIQNSTKEETDFYNNYIELQKKYGPMYTFPLYTITDECIGCATCSKVCPKGCIEMKDKRPDYNYTECINCMACIQSCPKKAIKFKTVKEPNPDARYRNPHISMKEIIDSNNQKI